MARYHLAAAEYVGFELHSIAATPGSSRARLLAESFGISHFRQNPEELLSDEAWDAIVIAVDVPATLALTRAAAGSGRPVLVEKPVAEFAREMEADVPRFPNVRVAYNRRFYPSAEAAKRFLEQRRPAQVMAQIPESFAALAAEGRRGLAVRYNSVHVFDLLRYLLGDLTPEAVHFPGSVDDDLGRVMVLRSPSADNCVVYANWDHPANFSVVIDAQQERLELRPLEFAYHYRGIEVEEPTAERPLRMYRPTCVAEVGLESEADRFKPGFVGQMQAFRSFVDGDSAGRLASLADAEAALRLAEWLVDGTLD